MISAHVSGIALQGPGLDGWAASRGVLAGQRPYQPAALPPPAGASLPATERRRATQVTRLVVDVAAATLAASGLTDVATVFASSGGEVAVIHQIFEELTQPAPILSPTQFHNSVHNTAAGYWSIATGVRTPSSSICGFDDSFGCGLLEALVQCSVEQLPVLLIACDYPPLFPLSERRPLTAPFAAGLLLTPHATMSSLARLRAAQPATPLTDPALEALRCGNPAARSLPLLVTLAAGLPDSLTFGCGMAGSVRVEVSV
jgi:hypothetical protein